MPTGRPLTGAALHSHLTKTCPAPPAPKGNTRAAKHGAKSLHMLGPAREKHMKALRTDYPNLDNRRLALLADRLARIDLASSWLDKQKGIVHTEDGGVFLIAKEVEKWASRAEVLLERAEAEGRRMPRRGSYDAARQAVMARYKLSAARVEALVAAGRKAGT